MFGNHGSAHLRAALLTICTYRQLSQSCAQSLGGHRGEHRLRFLRRDGDTSGNTASTHMAGEAAHTNCDASRQTKQALPRRATARRAWAIDVREGLKGALRRFGAALSGARRIRAGDALSRRGAAHNAGDQASETGRGHGGSGQCEPAKDFCWLIDARSILNTAECQPEYSRRRA